VPVRGEVSGRIHTVASAPVLDLSEGGALLEVPCVLRPRSLYAFRLSLGEGQVLTLQSSVVRSYVHGFEPIGGGESRLQYRAAIQFHDVSPADRALLRARLYAGQPPPEIAERPPGEASAEALLGDILGEPVAAHRHAALEGLTALLEERDPAETAVAAPEAPAPPAAPETPALPPLPDLASLPPLPDVEPWTPTAATGASDKPIERSPKDAAEAAAPVAAPSVAAAAVARPTPEQASQPAPPAARAKDEPAAASARGKAADARTGTAAVPPSPAERPSVAGAPDRQEGPSAWQRLMGWMSSKPERANGSSILGLEAPARGAQAPPETGERRDFARVVVEGAVTGQMGLVMHSEVEALSVGGLLARVPFAPEWDSRLVFTLDIDDSPLEVEGVVRHVQESRRDGGDVEYLVGLEFGALEQRVRNTIRAYVDRRLEDEEFMAVE